MYLQYSCKYVVGLVGVHRLTCWHDHVYLITSINYSYITCLRLKKEDQCVRQGKEKEQGKEKRKTTYHVCWQTLKPTNND